MKSAFIFVSCLLLQSFSFATPPLTHLEGLDLVNNKSLKVDVASSNKGTVLVFLSAKCPCSASHEDLLNKLSTEFKEFSFVGIHSNADESIKDSSVHFESAHLNFPILQDNKSTWANHLGALKTPHAFVLNSKGEILYQGGVTDSHVGPSSKRQFLKEVLDDIQNGKTPRIKEGRALGCFIQREE
ncbi:DUF6436 domain-containing protein [Bdellovibrio svalbardensis]|uniref:Redoxin family protein n=1 Tax=Bdellovibrio svalbardensis TaxID=2972972 RepID=A0ABT6DIG2_9BACT|nr:redoxin family protein [Bdellovibrio svalbardensis]MDG0816309.1 redoxin family protein [Bdellovibrio svalbardensis]